MRRPTPMKKFPGLIRKCYGIAPMSSSLVGVYLWENKAAAGAFYTADWVAMVDRALGGYRRSGRNGDAHGRGRDAERRLCCRRMRRGDLNIDQPG